jgi:hypothetical protein
LDLLIHHIAVAQAIDRVVSDETLPSQILDIPTCEVKM